MRVKKDYPVKYSIIIPIYNVESYLEECIDSVLIQNIENFELILVDDGSPDNCPEICDRYEKKDSRIKVVHKENGGLSDARNAGIKIAKGEYILFIDPDDYVEENYLEVIEHNIDGCDLLVFSLYDLYKNARIREYGCDEVLTRDKALQYLVSDDKFCGYACNKVFKKKIIDRYGLLFDPNVIMCEDILFSYQYIKRINVIKTISIPIYNYRQRKSSLVSKRIKDINNKPLFETYHYIINDSTIPEVQKKSKSLYLKYYYKYNRHILDGVVDERLIQDIIKNDYSSFSNHDKRLILMFKNAPFLRTLALKAKGVKNRKFA